MSVFLPRSRVPLPTKDVCSWIFDKPQYDIEKPCLIDANDPANSVNLAQARTLVRKLIAGLRTVGVKPGDTVCLHSSNSIYYPVLLLAIVGCGALFLGTNPTYTAGELAHQLKNGSATWIITETGGTSQSVLKHAENAAYTTGIPRDNILVFDHGDCDGDPEVPSNWKSWRHLLAHGEEEWNRFDDYEKSRTTTAMLCFSSGTTGLPKAIMISHMNIIAEHVGVFDDNPRDYHASRIVALPMFHVAIGMVANFSTLKDGQTSYIYRRFNPDVYLTAHGKYKITEILIVPPMVVACIKSPLKHKRDLLKTVRWAQCGAAPMTKETQSQFQILLSPGGHIVQTFGMTEGSCLIFLFPVGESDDTGSSGRLIANLEAKLIDPATSNPITTANTPGEICLRGPTITRGYFRNADANAALFTPDGFLKTGDIGYCSCAPTDHNSAAAAASSLTTRSRSRNKDPTGLFYILDRRREMLKVRGFQVTPAEIEAVLLSHPDVLDAAVIGMPGDDEVGELVRAYVVGGIVKTGDDNARGRRTKVTEDELQQWVAQRLARFKWLTGGVRFVDAIPKTASGKIIKREIRAWAEREEEESRRIGKASVAVGGGDGRAREKSKL